MHDPCTHTWFFAEILLMREPSPRGGQDFTQLRGKSRFWLIFGTLLCQVPADPNLHCQRRALYIGKTMNQAAPERGPQPTPALLFGFGRSLLPSARGNNWRFEDQSQSCPAWLCRCVSPAGRCPAGNCSQAKPVCLQGVVGFWGVGEGCPHRPALPRNVFPSWNSLYVAD